MENNKTYPNDCEYEEVVVSDVKRTAGGYQITRDDGWSFFVGDDSPVVPVNGMAARFYGKGIGHPVRGLYLDGLEVFYRTGEEDEIKRKLDTYGADATDWLSRWDDGKSVWSVEMGSLGPGYEQAIQIAVTEIIRHLISKAYCGEHFSDESFGETREKIYEAMQDNDKIDSLGLSGAQFGAAISLAVGIYVKGPAVVIAEVDRKRLIQVSKNFPRG